MYTASQSILPVPQKTDTLMYIQRKRKEKEAFYFLLLLLLLLLKNAGSENTTGMD
jgi:hypothetical protein